MTLTFLEAEKRINDMLVFPSFNLSIEKGQIVAIYTNVNIREQIIDLLLGKSSLSHGEIQMEGSDETNNQQPVGFLFLENGLYERLTVEEMLIFTKRMFGATVSIDSVIKILQLETISKIRIKQLSYSEQKRVQFACLLIQDPSIYVLEEPDQNLDLESKRIYLLLLEQLRKSNKVILIITGNLEGAITAADKVFRLDDNGLISVQMKSDNSDNEKESEDESREAEDINPISLDKIPSKVNDKIVLFHPPEIDYIESNDGQSYLYVKGESFPCAFTLQKLEERLLPFGFFRCHRSYIVNLQKVREVITWTRNSYSLVLENTQKSTIPLSKSKMTELKDMIGL